MTQEATLEELQAQLAEDEQAVEDARDALETAQAALEKGRKEPIERLLELSKAVTSAQNALNGEEKAAARTASRIQNFAFEAKKGVRETHKANLEDSIATQVNWDALIDAGVEEFKVTGSCENRTVSVKFSGPGITSGRTGTTRDPGIRGKWMFTANGNTMGAADYLKEYGPQVLTGKTPIETILANPASYGLSNYAQRVANKLGHSFQKVTS